MDPSSETDFPGISKMQSELQVWVGGGGEEEGLKSMNVTIAMGMAVWQNPKVLTGDS